MTALFVDVINESTYNTVCFKSANYFTKAFDLRIVADYSRRYEKIS